METQTFEIAVAITLWYLTSFGTLLLNKHLLGTLHINPSTLAVIQMTSATVYGALKTLSCRDVINGVSELRAACDNRVGVVDSQDVEGLGFDKGHKLGRWRRSLMQMGIVGTMRFATVVLGLVSLKHVAASFTETIKASAPFFTMIIAYLMLGESTERMVVMSLLPVAGGLVMVSYTELSFNMIGFTAAVATNVIECLQNVFSKRLLAREYTAWQLQFYTSFTALVLQAPLFLFNRDSAAAPPTQSAFLHSNVTNLMEGLALNATSTTIAASAEPLSYHTLGLLWVDGLLYHMQSVVAYVVMSYLSPVTVSVVNTLKRALLIWISVLVFGNKVTPLAQLGTAICLLGAFWYNIARQSTTQEANKGNAKG